MPAHFRPDVNQAVTAAAALGHARAALALAGLAAHQQAAGDGGNSCVDRAAGDGSGSRTGCIAAAAAAAAVAGHGAWLGEHRALQTLKPDTRGVIGCNRLCLLLLRCCAGGL